MLLLDSQPNDTVFEALRPKLQIVPNFRPTSESITPEVEGLGYQIWWAETLM